MRKFYTHREGHIVRPFFVLEELLELLKFGLRVDGEVDCTKCHG